ncbi:MAG: hypothetical protein JRH10_00960 [Deltaproteobacteria bacterium]|nr:hypothetical protein [Deltaproteobacteria bacterium]MBW2447317.1 hypothetical protein [Deltaproteobacteria bacterium]
MPARDSPAAQTPWVRESDDRLLDIRLCDLGVGIEGTALAARIASLHDELARAGLRFRPYIWLSTDWFTPDGHTGFAVPFYLAHPRLAHLERRQMYAVEGGNHDDCMKLLRHETAHALDNAYRLHWRKRWREHFGKASDPYRWSYVPDPESREHVLNIDHWYAQSHPVEDFAETFAVWLRPGERWRAQYAEWPAALKKLWFVDELMEEVGAKPARMRTRARPDAIGKLKMTLREYYEEKKAFYGDVDRSVYDRELLQLFSNDPAFARRRAAAAVLREWRRELRSRVANWTGQYPFVIDEVLQGMILRARELNLRLYYSERETVQDAAIVLTMHTMRHIRGTFREYHR